MRGSGVPKGSMIVRVALGLACVTAMVGGWSAVETVSAARVPLATTANRSVPIRIMPLGASSTVGARSPETGGYRGPLELLLAKDGIAYDMVGSQQQGPSWMPDRDHEGHGGATVPVLLPSVAGWVRNTHPDLVLLHVGTNDLLRGATGAETTARLQQMLTAIWGAEPRAVAPYVVVAGAWAPLPNNLRGKVDFAKGAAALVTGLRKQGKPVTFVDTATLLPAIAVADGLHANSRGYELIAAMWEKEIKKYVAATRSAVH